MAIEAGSLIEWTVGGRIFSQTWMNVWQYKVIGELGSPSTTNLAEALWNNLKVSYRALICTAHGAAFEFSRVRELDSLVGEYGEWPIPTGERAGTGTAGAGGVVQPFVAAGLKLAVGTRVTRPGAKRIPGQDEADANGASWELAYVTKLNTFCTAANVQAVLGAPAVGTEVKLHVVRKDPNTGLPIVSQPVIALVPNLYITSQVSRKIGRGI